jgi:hypothetical protein
MHNAKARPQELRVVFSRHPAGLRVHVTGASTMENTIAYWRAIMKEAERRDPPGILLIDELQGTPLSAKDWLALVTAMTGLGLERRRIAHVKPHGLQQLEYCEIYAKEAGFDAHVFAEERSAALWLQFGERRHGGPRT